MIFKLGYKRLLFLLCCLTALQMQAQQTGKVISYTDKSFYHAGETLWFGLRALDADKNQPSASDAIAYVELLDSSNKPVLQSKIAITEAFGGGNLVLPLTLPSGTYIFRAYDSRLKEHPALFSSKALSIYNIQRPATVALNRPTIAGGDLAISLKSDKGSYSSRDKIRIEVNAETDSRLTVSVYRLDSINTLPVPEEINEDVRTTYTVPQKPLHQSSGHLVSGRVVNKTNGQPAENVIVYFFVPGIKQLFSTAVSDPSGNIEFRLKHFYGVSEIMLQTDSNYRVEVKDPYSNIVSTSPLSTGSITSVSVSNPVTLLEQSVSAQVQAVYHNMRQNEFILPPIDSMPFYGKSDANYQLDDYVKFESMEDVLREYVAPVGLHRRNKKVVPFVYDALRRKPFSNPPLVLVDGIPILDMEKFMEIHPSIISRINIVNRRYFFGKTVFDGIIDVDTRINFADSVGLDKNVQVFRYDGLQATPQFYSPVYETFQQRESKLPDFRNVLYWTGDIRLSQKQGRTIDFYSSDLKGKFAVVAQAFNDEGKTGSKVIIIEVN